MEIVKSGNMEKGGEISDDRIETALRQYAETALWSSINYDDYEEGEEREFDADYSTDDITPETMESMRRDVKKFYEENIDLINASGLDDEQIGHDFWLTRHHHGTGFWDRDIPEEVGKKLTDASQKFNDYLLYAEDGKVKAEHLEKGGRLKSAVARERKYTSQEEHEKGYKNKRKSRVRYYQTHEKGGATGSKYKISYQKRWHPTEGTVYTQTVKIDNRTYDHLRDAVASEIAMDYPQKNKYVSTSGYEFYLKPLVVENGIVYLNHTQARFINMFLKLPLKDRNTRLKVVSKLSFGGLLGSGDDGIYWLITG